MQATEGQAVHAVGAVCGVGSGFMPHLVECIYSAPMQLTSVVALHLSISFKPINTHESTGGAL